MCDLQFNVIGESLTCEDVSVVEEGWWIGVDEEGGGWRCV